MTDPNRTDTATEKYEGEFRAGKRHGVGVFKSAGTSQGGVWANDKWVEWMTKEVFGRIDLSGLIQRRDEHLEAKKKLASKAQDELGGAAASAVSLFASKR